LALVHDLDLPHDAGSDMITIHHYCGARIEVSQAGADWKATVFLPGTFSGHPFVPHASGPNAQASVLDQARQLVNEVARDDEVA